VFRSRLARLLSEEGGIAHQVVGVANQTELLIRPGELRLRVVDSISENESVGVLVSLNNIILLLGAVHLPPAVASIVLLKKGEPLSTLLATASAGIGCTKKQDDHRTDAKKIEKRRYRLISALGGELGDEVADHVVTRSRVDLLNICGRIDPVLIPCLGIRPIRSSHHWYDVGEVGESGERVLREDAGCGRADEGIRG